MNDMNKNRKIILSILLISLLLIIIINHTLDKKYSIGEPFKLTTAIKDEINKLFEDNNSKKLVVYPPTRKISIQKGHENLGFVFSIRNVLEEEANFSYEISAVEVKGCNIELSDAEKMISFKEEKTEIQLKTGSVMEEPVFVIFNILKTAPSCHIIYNLNVRRNQVTYENASIGLEILP